MNFGTRQFHDAEKQEEVVIMDSFSVINEDSLIEVAALDDDHVVIVLNDSSLKLSWPQFKGFIEQIFGVSQPILAATTKLRPDKGIKNV